MDARIRMMDGNIISIRVPIQIKRYGGKKLILLPEGAQMTPPKAIPKPDETLVKALAKAYYWHHLIDTRRYKSIDEMSRQRNINAAYISRILRLNQLAPQIKKVILDGTQPRQLSLHDMETAFPHIWDEQLTYFGFA